jgi:hypothetical protein
MFKSEGARSWVFPYCFSEVGDGLFVLALPSVKLASLLPAIGTLWVEPNPRANVRDCLVELSFCFKGKSAVMESRGI